MKNIFIYLCILIFAVYSGCQQTEILEPDTAYKEKTVVFARLKEGKTLGGVTITRTLPLNVKYDIKLAEIKDATVYLKKNGAQIIPLAYDSAGLYKPLHLITVNAGTTYELFATVKGKKIYSRTYIPFQPSIKQAHLLERRYYTASFTTRSDEVYGAAWVIPGAHINAFLGVAEDFQEVTDPENIKPGSLVTLRTIDIPQVYQTESYFRIAAVKVIAYDKQYYNYFKTKSNNQQITNSFTQGGGQTIWNVYGQDVIGLFIGSAEGPTFKPN